MRLSPTPPGSSARPLPGLTCALRPPARPPAQVMWLSERHAEVEARLQELGWRLKPIDDAVSALRDLDAYIRTDMVRAHGGAPSIPALCYACLGSNSNESWVD